MKRLLQCAREKCLCVRINGTIQANVSSWAPCGVKGYQVGMGLNWANVVGAIRIWAKWAWVRADQPCLGPVQAMCGLS